MTTLSASDLRYPVLYLSQRAGIGTAMSPDALLKTWPVLIRSGFFAGLRLVSEDEDAFEVTNAKVVSPASATGRWLAGVFSLPLRVELQIKKTAAIPLPRLRDEVLTELEKNSHEVEEHTGQSVDWWRRHLTDAASTSEFVRRFAAGVAAG